MASQHLGDFADVIRFRDMVHSYLAWHAIIFYIIINIYYKIVHDRQTYSKNNKNSKIEH